MPSQRARDHVLFFGPANDYWVGLLTITNPDPALNMEPLRLCSMGDRNFVSRGETFFSSGFNWKLPSRDEGESRSTLQIPVLDQTILQKLRSTQIRFQLLLEVVMYQAPDVVELTYKLVERGKSYDPAAQMLLVDATFRDIFSNPRPRLRYSPTRFPVLFARTTNDDT